MAPTSLSQGVHVVSDVDRLRMPGHDTRFAGGVVDPATVTRPVARPRRRAGGFLSLLRRPVAQGSH